MIELITGLFSGGGGIIALGAAIVAMVAGIFITGKRAGKAEGRAKAAEHSNRQWREADEIFGKVSKARRNARKRAGGDSLYDDDGFKRPRR